MLPILKMYIGYGRLPRPFSWHVVHHPPPSCRQGLSDTSVPQLAEPQHPAAPEGSVKPDLLNIVQYAWLRECSIQLDIVFELHCRDRLWTKTVPFGTLLCMFGCVVVWRVLKQRHAWRSK